jgi:uncharacterized protein
MSQSAADPIQPTFGGPRPPASTSLSPATERNWATAAHLSGFAAAYVALGFLGPLVVLLVAGDKSPFIRRHAVEALNFNLSWLLYIGAALILSVILIGLPVLLALGIGYVVFVILAAMEASRGGEYRYPLTVRFVS